MEARAIARGGDAWSGVPASSDIDWGLFLSTVMVRVLSPTRFPVKAAVLCAQWSYTGWDSLGAWRHARCCRLHVRDALGTIAGEVKDSRRTYAVGSLLALLLVSGRWVGVPAW